MNNPVRYIDKNGEEPGDPFKSVEDAAKDWGMYYNGASILRGKEFGSTIYKMQQNGRTRYTYSEAAEGIWNRSRPSLPPNGEKIVADIHSHGKYDQYERNNDFSNIDKWGYYYKEKDGYLATPDGSLKKYDPYTAQTTVISTDLPSDPKDPGRKNDVTPTDKPKEKMGPQTRVDVAKKVELKNVELKKVELKK